LALAILMACFEGGGAGGKGAANDRLAVLGEHLHIDARAVPVLFEQTLCGQRALAFVDFRPGFGKTLQRRVTAENPGVLVQRVAKQHRQAGNQRDGQPECREYAPEQ